jgi:hypothetical protein
MLPQALPAITYRATPPPALLYQKFVVLLAFVFPPVLLAFGIYAAVLRIMAGKLVAGADLISFSAAKTKLNIPVAAVTTVLPWHGRWVRLGYVDDGVQFEAYFMQLTYSASFAQLFGWENRLLNVLQIYGQH